MMKSRYIALTDVNRGVEIDDIQSIVRLLMYSDVIDVEGIISCSSCFVKKTGAKQERIIHKHIDAYNKVKPNLDVHSPDYPSADYLHGIARSGIPVFGKTAGVDFANEKYNDNDGVQLIYKALQRDDSRPLWFGLWGGANTLAQALWMVDTYLPQQKDRIFSRVRIYNISDQDYASKWIREQFGDKLFIIVSPSGWTSEGSKDYYRATWPGISSDRFEHGSEDGINRTKGFSGADYRLIDNGWIFKNVKTKGPLGRRYPFTRFITEGDTPSFLGLIPNGLNIPEHIEYGGWGGRYVLQSPDGEPYPIYSDDGDTVLGNDGKLHTSPQATIWRWREDFQNDFANRLKWCVSPSFGKCKHTLKIGQCRTTVDVKRKEAVSLSVNATSPDNDSIIYEWFHYPEAGGNKFKLKLNTDENRASFEAPDETCTVHIIAKAHGDYSNPFVSYVRFIVNVS